MTDRNLAIYFHATPDLRARLDAEVARQRAQSGEPVSLAAVLRGLIRSLPEAPREIDRGDVDSASAQI